VQRRKRTSNHGILDPILHYIPSACPQLPGTKQLYLKTGRGSQLVNPDISYVVVVVVVVMMMILLLLMMIFRDSNNCSHYRQIPNPHIMTKIRDT
jgi:hypothetical protein